MSARVWLEHAFLSFGDTDDYAAVQEILGRAVRPRARQTPPSARLHQLPSVYCAHPVDERPVADAAGRAGDASAPAETVQVCGRRLHPLYVAQRTWGYRSSRCCDEGHHTTIPNLVEQAVLTAVLARFTPDALRRVIDKAWVQASAERRQLPALREAVAVLEARADGAMEAEAEYRARKDHDRVARAQRLQQKLAAQLDEARRALARFEQDAERLGVLAKADGERVLALATDLPRLVARVASVPGAVAQLAAVLLRGVHVRRDTLGVLHVGLEYPTGAFEWIQITTMTVRARQPERAYALGRLAEGAAAGEVAAELNERRGAERWRTAWTAERVAGLAAQWEGRDPDEDATTSAGRRRCGPASGDGNVVGRPVEEIADAVGADPSVVWSLALREKLGQAVFVNGELLLAPTRRLLHHHFPDAARRHVSEAAGWPLDDVVLVAGAAADLGHDPDYAERRATAGAGIRRDGFGRRYMRRSDLDRPLPGRWPRQGEPDVQVAEPVGQTTGDDQV